MLKDVHTFTGFLRVLLVSWDFFFSSLYFYIFKKYFACLYVS